MLIRKLGKRTATLINTLLIVSFLAVFTTPAEAWDLTGFFKRNEKNLKNFVESPYTDARLLKLLMDKTGIDPMKSIQKSAIFADLLPSGPIVGAALMGSFDEKKLTNELLSDKELNASEATVGDTKYFVTEKFNFLFSRDMIIVSPTKASIFGTAELFKSFMDSAKSLKSDYDIEFKTVVSAGLVDKLLTENNAQDKLPPEAITVIKGIRNISYTSLAQKMNLTFTMADPELAQMAGNYFSGLSAFARVLLGGVESGIMEKAPSASAFKILSEGYLGTMHAVNLGKALLDKIVFETKGSNFSLSVSLPESLADNAMLLPVIIGAVGIAAAIAIPNFTKARSKARGKACIANMRVLEGAMEMYQMDHDDYTPANGMIKELLGETLVKDGYLRQFPECKDGGEYKLIGAPDAPRIECSIHGTIDSAK